MRATKSVQTQDFSINTFTFGLNIPFETTSNTNVLDAVHETFQHFSNWNYIAFE